jgi:hypothetical protein
MGSYRRYGNSIGNLAHYRPGRTQGRTLDLLLTVPIYHDRREYVECGVGKLQQIERLWEFSGIFQFGNKAEKRDVASWKTLAVNPRSESKIPTICKYNIRDGKEPTIEIVVDSRLDLFPRMFNANSNHGDHDC